MSNKVWGEIAYPFLNCNGGTVEVWELKHFFIPHLKMDVIAYPCWDRCQFMLIYGDPGDMSYLTEKVATFLVVARFDGYLKKYFIVANSVFGVEAAVTMCGQSLNSVINCTEAFGGKNDCIVCEIDWEWGKNAWKTNNPSVQ